MKRGYTLHVYIAVIFIAFILAVGTVLGGFNYRENSALIWSAADQVFIQIEREVLLDFHGIYHPVASVVNLFAQEAIAKAGSLEERIAAMPALCEALRNHPQLAALQVSYSDGDYVLLQTAHTFSYQGAGLPEGTGFVLEHRNNNTEKGRQYTQHFFDDKLVELARRRKDSEHYDPRQEAWYSKALASSSHILSQPCILSSTKRMGLTVDRGAPDGAAVVTAHLTIERLSSTLSRHLVASSAEMVLFDDTGQSLAYISPERLTRNVDEAHHELAHLSELESTALNAAALSPVVRDLRFQHEGAHWRGAIRAVKVAPAAFLYLAVIAPEEELLADAIRIRRQGIWIVAAIVLLALPVAWLLARQISQPLHQLALETKRIRQFDFTEPVQIRSRILEIDELADSMETMKSTIGKFSNLILSLSGEKDFDRLLDRITQETLEASHADAAVLYLLNDEETDLEAVSLRLRNGTVLSPCGALSVDGDDHEHPILQTFNTGVFKVSTYERGASSEVLAFSALAEALDAPCLSITALSLQNRNGEAAGVLCLAHPNGAGDSMQPAEGKWLGFVRALSGFAAVSLESRRLFRMQKDLLESFIQLIAGAIDAKSPYTGGHCQRVPAIATTIAEAACDSTSPPFDRFQLSEDEREALHIACWLHDCGKVTTPEFVVDKATKLETIHDRIHEVRMRFEVLKRDAEIHCLAAIAAGGDENALRATLKEELERFDQDFAFVAECNLGGEFMAPERIERLKKIAGQTWMRTIDARLGLSEAEVKRMEGTHKAPLPVVEQLLADKPEHLISRDREDHLPGGDDWGFKLDMPQHKYNRGEIHNLSIGRGTLTTEERYKINDHIVQTIIMLGNLPYPKHLRSVPEIAGGHHEKMDGSGYPRRLKANEMSLMARMMAVADIFEALTAADRPYKASKTLSEAIRIMGFMCKDGHIDPDVFRLFLESGVYKQYAKDYLKADQIDEVPLSDYLP